ncbi:MAG: TrkH family potassium uptake protein [Erysipelotrichia bacterium]|nr:TrkH family potassium uptake protein [Erysipelotrichia bacterium]
MKNDYVIDKQIEGYSLVLGYIGVILMIIGCITLLPLLTLFIYPQEANYAIYFMIPAMIAILLGYILYWRIRGYPRGHLRKQHDCVIVVSAWICAVFFSAMPFFLLDKYNFSQGMFESMSAWSTTGLSIVDVDNTPHLYLMHRSIVLFFGGVGLVLVMLSVLSDSYGMNLYNAEGHNDRLLPNLIKSSRMIMSIYSTYIAAGTILYMLAGMNAFDAINHAISAVSTGGFSTRSESIAYYKSIPIEMISIVLMLLGGTNFMAHLFLIRGKFKHFFQYCEVKLSLLIILFVTIIVSTILCIQFSYLLENSIRIGLFQIVSALTTTGFQNIPVLTVLPQSVLLIMVFLHLIGGGIGSTAGGIKQYRVYVAFKNITWNIANKLSSKRKISIQNIFKVGGKQKISKSEKSEISAYILLYIAIFIIGTMIFVICGNSVLASMFEFSSALGTVGLSLGIINYLSDPIILWTGIVGMFMGRLEIYVVFIALFRVYNDVKAKCHHKERKQNL